MQEGARVRTFVALIGAAIVAVTAAVYWPGRTAGFVGDDFMILHRLRQLSGAGDIFRFFRGEFFEYYRPLGFVLHAVDWFAAGAEPVRFHLTNLALHLASTLLVLLIGWKLAPRSVAGPVAALLFALHASHHEAVMWIAARFDLLATTMCLAAVYAAMSDTRVLQTIVGPVLFLLALLSKESAVALPIAIAGWLAFQTQVDRRERLRRLQPWLGALLLYAILRRTGGGVSSFGGVSRLPKLIAFAALLTVVALPGRGVWTWARHRLRPARGTALFVLCLLLGVAGLLCATTSGPATRIVAEKLAAAGFAIVHLASPVVDIWDRPFYLSPDTTSYWAGGIVALAAAALLLYLLWRPAIDDDRIWFLATMLVATWLPVSALTEGKRYLYLPSASVCLMTGVLVAQARAATRVVALVIVGLVNGISVAQISAKVRDWRWAGQMTAEGARLADAALAPRCGTGHVVFLTSPVAVRGVYTHFYYETLEFPRGCTPAAFEVVARLVRVDAHVDVRWVGPARIVVSVPDYRGNLVVSRDLRTFDIPLPVAHAPVMLDTPLGAIRAGAAGTVEEITIDLSPAALREGPHFFYFSDGKVRPLASPWGDRR